MWSYISLVLVMWHINTNIYIYIYYRSRTVHNTKHPYWNEVLDLGYHRSGDSITIKVYDADSGLEVSQRLRFNSG